MARDRQVTVTIVGDARSLGTATASAANSLDALERKATTSGSKMSSAFGAEVEGKLKGLTGQMGPLGAAIEGLGPVALAGGAAFAGLAIAAKASVSTFTTLAGEVASFKRITQASAEDSSKLVAALDDVGISADTGALAFKKLAQNVDSKAFKALGIDVAKAKDGTTDLVGTLQNIITKLDGIHDPAQRANILIASMGKNAEALGPLLDKGADGFRKMLEANKGQILSDDDLKKARDFKAAMDNLGDTLKEFEIRIGRDVVPVVVTFVKQMTLAVDAAEKFTHLKAPDKSFWESMFGLSGGKSLVTGLEAITGAQLKVKEASSEWASNLGTAYANKWNEISDALTTSTTSTTKNRDAMIALAEAQVKGVENADKLKGFEDAVAQARIRVADATTAGAAAIRSAEDGVTRARKDSVAATHAVVEKEKELVTERQSLYDSAMNQAAAEDALDKLFEVAPPNLAKVAEAEAALAKARDESTSAAGRAQSAQEALKKAQDDLADGQLNDGTRADRSLDRSHRDLTRATLDLGAKEEDLRQKRAAGTTHWADLERLELDVADARDRVQDATDRVAKAEKDRDGVADGLAKKAQTVVEKTRDLEKANKDNETATKNVATAESTLAQERAGRVGTQDQINAAVDKLKGLLEEVKTKTEGVKTKESELGALRETQKEQPGKIADAETALADATKKAAAGRVAAYDAVTAAIDRQRLGLIQLDIQAAKDNAKVVPAVDPRTGGQLGATKYGPHLSEVGAVGSGGSLASLAARYLGQDEGGANSIFKPGALLAGQDPVEAWCQKFINAILAQAGTAIVKGANTDSTRTDFEAWVKAGRKDSSPQAGDLAYKTRPGDWKGHAGIVESVDLKQGTVTVISGNSGNKVTRTTTKITDWDLGFINPGGSSERRHFGGGGYDTSGLDSLDPLTDIERAALSELKKQGMSTAQASREWKAALLKNGGDAEAAARSLGVDITTGLDDLSRLMSEKDATFDESVAAFAAAVAAFGSMGAGRGVGAPGAPIPTLAPPITLVAPPQDGMVWDGTQWVWPPGKGPGTPGPGAGNIIRLLPPGSLPGLAEGGYVNPTPGGTVVRLGEGGQGEYVIPRSKMGGGNIIVNVNVAGMIGTQREIAQSIGQELMRLRDRGVNV